MTSELGGSAVTSEHSVHREKSLREAASGGAAAHTAGETPQPARALQGPDSLGSAREETSLPGVWCLAQGHTARKCKPRFLAQHLPCDWISELPPSHHHPSRLSLS